MIAVIGVLFAMTVLFLLLLASGEWLDNRDRRHRELRRIANERVQAQRRLIDTTWQATRAMLDEARRFRQL